jgi:ubiquitin-conjugating enzyme E2 Z
MDFVSKETIKRLLKDVKHIIQNPLIDNGIYYCHDDTDMLKGYALIIGPEDTPYFGGNYFFEFKYPIDYPHTPPKVTYCTNGEEIRFNPNLYKCGKVCVSILNTWSGDQWTSCQTISTVLLTLCSLLCKSPLLNEPGVNNTHHEIEKYSQIIEYSNLNIAVCQIVSKKEGYKPFFNLFYPYVKEHFLKNYDFYVEFATQKANHYRLLEAQLDAKEKDAKEKDAKEKDSKKKEKANFIRINFYMLSVVLDYDTVLKKLKSSKDFLELKIN